MRGAQTPHPKSGPMGRRRKGRVEHTIPTTETRRRCRSHYQEEKPLRRKRGSTHPDGKSQRTYTPSCCWRKEGEEKEGGGPKEEEETEIANTVVLYGPAGKFPSTY